MKKNLIKLIILILSILVFSYLVFTWCQVQRDDNNYELTQQIQNQNIRSFYEKEII